MRTSNAAIGNESRWEKKEKKEGATKQFHKYTKAAMPLVMKMKMY